MTDKPDGLPNLEELIWVEDLRSNQRFLVRRPLTGELDGENAQIRDLSMEGCRIAHRMYLRVGANTTLRIGSPPATPLEAKVVWSRLSDDREPEESLLYTSGMKIVDDPQRVAKEVDPVVRSHCRADTSSMETKRLRALELMMDRMTVERDYLEDLAPEVLLQSYEALAEVRRMNSDDWKPLIEKAQRRLASEKLPSAWSREVLAAWGLIDGKVDLETIEVSRKILSELDRFVEDND